MREQGPGNMDIKPMDVTAIQQHLTPSGRNLPHLCSYKPFCFWVHFLFHPLSFLPLKASSFPSSLDSFPFCLLKDHQSTLPPFHVVTNFPSILKISQASHTSDNSFLLEKFSWLPWHQTPSVSTTHLTPLPISDYSFSTSLFPLFPLTDF